MTITSKAALGERSVSAPTVNGVATFPIWHLTAPLELFARGDGPRITECNECRVCRTRSGIVRETWSFSPGTGKAEFPQRTPGHPGVRCRCRWPPIFRRASRRNSSRLRPASISSGSPRRRIRAVAEPGCDFGKKVKIAEVLRDTPCAKWPHTHEAASIPVTKPGSVITSSAPDATCRLISLCAGGCRMARRNAIPAARFVLPDLTETTKSLPKPTRNNL